MPPSNGNSVNYGNNGNNGNSFEKSNSNTNLSNNNNSSKSYNDNNNGYNNNISSKLDAKQDKKTNKDDWDEEEDLDAIMENEMKSINQIRLSNGSSPRSGVQGMNVTKNISTSSFASEGSLKSNHVRTY